MSQYRKRFVQLNMLLIGIVLTVMVAVVAVYMGRNTYTGLRMTMEQVVAPLRNFSQPPADNQAPQGKPDREAPEPGKNINVLTVFYSPGEGTYSVLSPGGAFTEEEVQTLLDMVVDQEKDFGVLSRYHAIYYRSGTTPYKIALVSTGYLTHSYISLGLVLLAIWAAAMLLFLAISIRLSAVAVKPMDEAMAREKQFVADASHDLKTPLSVILANTAIVAENPDATVGSVRRWLDSTHNAAKRMQELISQMLKLADVERRDKVEFQDNVDLSSIATKAALEMESVSYEKQVTLDTRLPEACRIRGNADYLLRIVSSLLENALKYEPSGGRVLLTLTEEKHKAVLSVRNFGSRIPEEDLPHVFDRFYRSDKSRQHESGSFGLGLAITREMTEKLGGTITAVSTPEIGTEFRCTFHRAKA